MKPTNSENTIEAPKRIIGRTVPAFHPDTPADHVLVDVVLLRHGPAVPAAAPAGTTEWETRLTPPDGQHISARADNTWTAWTTARRTLEMQYGLRLAVAGARRDHAVTNPERHRESTTVTHLLPTGGDVRGLLEDADAADIGTIDEQQQHLGRWRQIRLAAKKEQRRAH